MDLRDTNILLVPGLRDENPEHWQSLLAASLPNARSLPARGKADVDLASRVAEIEAAVSAATAPVVVVAHSGGAIATVHWANRTRLRPRGLLLATPPVLDELQPSDPLLRELQSAGWMPVPRGALPVPCIVAASRNDPLGSIDNVTALASGWGAQLVDLGEVGHLNPASGYGSWAQAPELIHRLAAGAVKAPLVKTAT